MKILFVLASFIFTALVSAQTTDWKLLGDSAVSSGVNVDIALSPTGIPYVSYISYSGLTPEIKKFENDEWMEVGNLTTGGCTHPDIFFGNDGFLHIIYVDQDGNVKCKIFDGNSWNSFGTSIFETDPYLLSVTVSPSGEFYLLFDPVEYGIKATVKKFNGTQWVTLGNPGFSESEMYFGSVAVGPDNIPYVAFIDEAHADKLSVMKFNGSTWEYVGGAGGASVGPAMDPSIAIGPNGIPYIAYTDNSDYQGRVIWFDGVSWQQLGGTYSEPSSNYLVIDSNNQLYVTFLDWLHDQKVSVIKYENNSWGYIGEPGFSPDPINFSKIAVDNTGQIYVAYESEEYPHKIVAMKFDSIYNGIQEKKKYEIQAYPNPVDENIFITISNQNIAGLTLELFDLTGRKLKEYAVTSPKMQLNLQELSSGIYFFQLENNNSKSVKIIKL